MQRIKRWIRTWLGITEGSYPHRFVVLTYWEGILLGVDGNGDFYEISRSSDGEPTFTFMQRNPLERRY